MIYSIESKDKELNKKEQAMDKIEVVDCLDEFSNNIQGIISLANMRLNDLNNPNGSLSSDDIQSILYVAVQLLSYQYKDIRNHLFLIKK